jgi:hypothetical protein
MGAVNNSRRRRSFIFGSDAQSMHKIGFNVAGALSIALVSLVLPGCVAGDVADESGAAAASSFEEELELGEAEQAVLSCSNVDGTNSVMAALAVSVAQELGRWQPSKDLAITRTNGTSERSPGSQQAIKLTRKGKARCADNKCYNTQALLDLQYDQANGQVQLPDDILLSPAALRSRLVAKLREQLACEAQPSNGNRSNCPVERHELTFLRAEQGGCDTNFFFKATALDGSALKYPAQLKNNLLWVDRHNPYVAFTSVGDTVSVDPTYGLNESGSTTTGSCTAACIKISSSSIAGQCCSCNGMTDTFTRSAWSATTFLCQ